MCHLEHKLVFKIYFFALSGSINLNFYLLKVKYLELPGTAHKC